MNAPQKPCCEQTMRDDFRYFFSLLTEEERAEFMRRAAAHRQRLIDAIDAKLGIAGALPLADEPAG